MDFITAFKSGLPFAHDDMIGAYMVIDGICYHRDHIDDFLIPEVVNYSNPVVSFLLNDIMMDYHVYEVTITATKKTYTRRK